MTTRPHTAHSHDEIPENYRRPGKSETTRDISPSAREMLGVLSLLDRNMF